MYIKKLKKAIGYLNISILWLTKMYLMCIKIFDRFFIFCTISQIKKS